MLSVSLVVRMLTEWAVWLCNLFRGGRRCEGEASSVASMRESVSPTTTGPPYTLFGHQNLKAAAETTQGHNFTDRHRRIAFGDSLSDVADALHLLETLLELCARPHGISHPQTRLQYSYQWYLSAVRNQTLPFVQLTIGLGVKQSASAGVVSCRQGSPLHSIPF